MKAGSDASLVPNERSNLAMHISNARRWSIIGLLFAASLINYFDRYTISVALPLISTELHLGPTTKGLLLSAFFWSYALMQIPIGLVVDRFNLRWVYAGAFALWSLAQGLTGLAGSLATLIGFRVLLGFGESVYMPGGSKVVSMLFPPKERGLPSGIFDFGTRTGLVVEGLLIPWLLVHSGWRRTFMIVGFCALVWLIPWLLVYPSQLRGPTAPRSGAAPRLLALLRSRNLLGICLGFFCWDYYWYLLLTWLPDYLVTVRHLTILRAGIYASLPFLVFGLGEPVGGWIADRLARRGMSETYARKGVITVAFFTGLLLIPAMRVESPNVAILLVMGGSLVGLASGNLLAIVQSCAPPEAVGLWAGTQNFFGNIAGVIAPLATGVLISRTGSYSPGFAVAAVVLVTGLLSYWFILGEVKPAGEHP